MWYKLSKNKYAAFGHYKKVSNFEEAVKTINDYINSEKTYLFIESLIYNYFSNYSFCCLFYIYLFVCLFIYLFYHLFFLFIYLIFCLFI